MVESIVPANDIRMGASKQNDNSRVTSETNDKTHMFLNVVSFDYFDFNNVDRSKIQICVSFRGQRLKTSRVSSKSLAMFQDIFLLKMPENMKQTNVADLLSNRDLINIIIIKHINKESEMEVMSFSQFDWRAVLLEGSLNTEVSCQGIGMGQNIQIGKLKIELNFVPELKRTIRKEVLEVQKSLENNKLNKETNRFIFYTKQWLSDYKDTRPETLHRSEQIKPVATDDNGVLRPVQYFLQKVSCGRILETAQEAAAFVSLFSLESGTGWSSGSLSSLDTILAKRSGSEQELSHLLCSLMLGFGLDAFVVHGRTETGMSYWVMSLGQKDDVVFHCPRTGSRVAGDGVIGDYKEVWDVYNQHHFWGNAQESCQVLDTCWDLNGEGWRKMASPKQLLSLTRARLPQLQLAKPSMDALALAQRLQIDLKYIIEERRRDAKLSTSWDESLSCLLGQALAGYESGRRGCSSQGQSRDFHCAVTRHTPTGHTFQAFPLSSTSMDAHQLLREGMESQVFRQVLLTCSGSVKLSVRVNCYIYPEDIISVWLMLASIAKLDKNKDL